MEIDRIHVISLDRTPERFAWFTERNAHLPITRFSAVDGRGLERDTCIADGLIAEANLYSRGALGSAASHVGLWRRCVEEGRPIHIAEDDAIIRRDFVEKASRLLAREPSWDVVLWGWNFDWPMRLSLAPGLGSTILACDQDELRRDWHDFADADVPSLLARLVTCSGICCYSVSPTGARRLLERVLPIGDMPASYPFNPELAVANTSLDLEMSRHYAQMQAFVAIPCLAISLNDQSASTIYRG